MRYCLRGEVFVVGNRSWGPQNCNGLLVAEAVESKSGDYVSEIRGFNTVEISV